jgi:hypothetical protein
LRFVFHPLGLLDDSKLRPYVEAGSYQPQFPTVELRSEVLNLSFSGKLTKLKGLCPQFLSPL